MQVFAEQSNQLHAQKLILLEERQQVLPPHKRNLGAIAGHGGLLKLLFRRDDRRLLGAHMIGDAASELVGMCQAVIHSNETIDIFAALTLNTPTYTYAYKYATFDGLLRLAATQGGPAALADLAASDR